MAQRRTTGDPLIDQRHDDPSGPAARPDKECPGHRCRRRRRRTGDVELGWSRGKGQRRTYLSRIQKEVRITLAAAVPQKDVGVVDLLARGRVRRARFQHLPGRGDLRQTHALLSRPGRRGPVAQGRSQRRAEDRPARHRGHDAAHPAHAGSSGSRPGRRRAALVARATPRPATGGGAGALVGDVDLDAGTTVAIRRPLVRQPGVGLVFGTRSHGPQTQSCRCHRRVDLCLVDVPQDASPVAAIVPD
jgi:hypothetical protein